MFADERFFAGFSRTPKIGVYRSSRYRRFALRLATTLLIALAHTTVAAPPLVAAPCDGNPWSFVIFSGTVTTSLGSPIAGAVVHADANASDGTTGPTGNWTMSVWYNDCPVRLWVDHPLHVTPAHYVSYNPNVDSASPVNFTMKFRVETSSSQVVIEQLPQTVTLVSDTTAPAEVKVPVQLPSGSLVQLVRDAAAQMPSGWSRWKAVWTVPVATAVGGHTFKSCVLPNTSTANCDATSSLLSEIAANSYSYAEACYECGTPGEIPYIASTHSWTSPTGVTCLGGDLEAVTIGEWIQTNHPEVYTSLNSDQRVVFNAIRNGSLCTTATNGPIGTGRTDLDPVDGSTPHPNASFGGSTPATCTGSYGTTSAPGCVTAQATLVTSHWFGFQIDYSADESLEARVFLAGDAFSWQPTATRLSDNRGGSGQLGLKSSTTTSYSDHTGYATGGKGAGYYVWFHPDPQTTATNVSGMEVHAGFAATGTQTYAMQPYAQAVCFFTEWTAVTMQVARGGWGGDCA